MKTNLKVLGLGMFGWIALMEGASAQAVAAKPEAPGLTAMLVPFGAMFVILYFLSIRPQQKKMKEHQKFISNLKEGDEVLTASGIFGMIRSIQDKTLTLEIDKGVKLKLLKSQISQSVKTDTVVSA